MEQPLVNRVSNSGLITINLENYYPQAEIVTFDLKDYLFMELILREKDFRKNLSEIDWSIYNEKVLTISCSTDAIIPVWAYMLVSAYAEGHAHEIYVGNLESYLTHYYQQKIAELDISNFENKRIVIKGCSEKAVPPGAYQALTKKLKPGALSIMYGEPCSTVPIYKRPK